MREFQLSQGHKELERQLTESSIIIKLRSTVTVSWVILTAYKTIFKLKKTWKQLFTKIEKQQRDVIKPQRYNDSWGWRRLKRITKNELEKFRPA